jgi:transcription-repair coupling factor (superfamily II helicase)
MLERAVRALRSGRQADLEEPIDISTEINLHTPALLPEAYCSDVHERLTLYKRMANCETGEELEQLREELVDRFGLLPEPAKALLECHALRIAAKAVGVSRVDATHEALQLQFIKHPPIDGAKIIALVERRKDLRLSGPEKLRLTAKMPAWPERAQAARDLLMQLAA